MLSALLPFCLAAGCKRETGTGATGPLAQLHAALKENSALAQQLKAGRIIRSDYNIKCAAVHNAIAHEFAIHKQDVWDYSMDILRKTPISKSTRSEIEKLKPYGAWRPLDEWDGGTNVLISMYSMLPLRLTSRVITPAFFPAEYADLQYAYRPVELLALTETECRTAFLFGYKIITVDFVRDDFRWKPLVVRVYYRKVK